ncbi:glycosyltransferase family 2 protein [filamentous cyanobacterium LEGE 11480]|uniref:Glycosyltransferase family 2 protein n=1 Tax=Romeriopsis navalis LEGE 11480 TaxID=2777977 RepID=A0A928Z1J6_9CYAN|nr:glycosyltransferase family 2 protein [Romeriopsis navalis]MBE9029416.1 glycosyltransferase family 2 protein [Romeriopsis navalis LEGE 11480]
MPKISVCIPTFNREHFLPIAIESVRLQTERDWELIVCDDGSNDRTVDIMAAYQMRDPRIRYVRHEQNVGKSNNMRSGFEAATGEYFIKFDDDDRLTPEFLAKTSQILADHDAIDFVGTDHWVIDPDNQRRLDWTDANTQKWGRSDLPEGAIENLLEVLFVKQSLQIGATLFRRDALVAAGYMRANIQNCEDNDLLVRLAEAGKSAYYLPERLMEYRFHPEQQSPGRAIQYLSDKLNYLRNFTFEQPNVERVRVQRIAETQVLLGLRLIEQGDTDAGRILLWQGRQHSPAKMLVGMALSCLPVDVRPAAFGRFR